MIRKLRVALGVAASAALLASVAPVVSADAAPAPVHPKVKIAPDTRPKIDKSKDPHASPADEVPAAQKVTGPRPAHGPKGRPHPVSTVAPPYGGTRMGDYDTAHPNPDGTVNGFVCTSGFNARSGSGAYYTLSSGHCGYHSPGNEWRIPCCPDPISSGIFGTEANVQYNSSGDRMAIRDSLAAVRQVRSGCCVYTVSGMRKPVVNEQACMILGNSARTLCATVYQLDVHPTLDDGTDHGNQWLMFNFASNGCPIGGDSGSPVLAGTVAIGQVNAVLVDGPYCWTWAEQLPYAVAQLGVNILF